MSFYFVYITFFGLNALIAFMQNSPSSFLGANLLALVFAFYFLNFKTQNHSKAFVRVFIFFILGLGLETFVSNFEIYSLNLVSTYKIDIPPPWASSLWLMNASLLAFCMENTKGLSFLKSLSFSLFYLIGLYALSHLDLVYIWNLTAKHMLLLFLIWFCYFSILGKALSVEPVESP